MRYKRATETTQVFLENQPLPNHGKSYTVIPHKTVIDNTLTLLKNSGFNLIQYTFEFTKEENETD